MAGEAPPVVEHHDDRGAAPDLRVRVPVLDGFRALATAAVVLYHCFLGAGLPQLKGGVLRSLIAVGYTGVDFFFVISGFVLFLPTVVNGGRFGSRREYARRRAARIVPAYWVFLALVLLLHTWLFPTPQPQPFASMDGFLQLLAHLTFLQASVGWFLGPHGYDVLTVAWTLAIEVCFYLLLPLVAVRYYRRPLVGLALALTLALAWRAFATNVPTTLAWMGADGWSGDSVALIQLALLTQLPNYLAHFAAGMTAAWAFVRLGAGTGAVATRRWALALQVAAGALLVRLLVAEGARSLQPPGSRGYYDSWTRTTPIALAFALVILGTALGPRWAQLPFRNRLARGLGEVSYGVYLSHLAVVGFALTTLKFAPDATASAFVRMVAVVVPTALLAGWLSWRIVERPARRWAARHRREVVTTTPWSPAEEGTDDLRPSPIP